MKQLDKKEQPEYKLIEHEPGTGQVLKIVDKTQKDSQNKETIEADVIFEKIHQNLKEAEQARQKATLVNRESSLRLKTAEENGHTANIMAEKTKERVSIAIERARQFAQKLFKARQKVKDAELISQRANLEAEEALNQLQKAQENKRMADFALEESKQRVREAQENQRIANFLLDEAKRREKIQAEEAKQKEKLATQGPKPNSILADKSKESDESAVLVKQSAFDDKIISPDNKDGLQGPLNLSISPGAQGSKIVRLILSLSSYSEIKIVSIDKSDDKGSRIELLVKKPMPLYQVLYGLPFVQQILEKENELQITLRSDE
jgi:hypothetical protein